MKKENEKIYRSMREIEKEFLPESYKKKLEEKKKKNSSISGTGLVTELLEGIKQEMTE
jgi:hypothetical protein